MKLIDIALLIIVVILGIYSWFYHQEVLKAKHRMGLTVPKHVDTLLKITTIFAIIVTIILGLMFFF